MLNHVLQQLRTRLRKSRGERRRRLQPQCSPQLQLLEPRLMLTAATELSSPTFRTDAIHYTASFDYSQYTTVDVLEDWVPVLDPDLDEPPKPRPEDLTTRPDYRESVQGVNFSGSQYGTSAYLTWDDPANGRGHFEAEVTGDGTSEMWQVGQWNPCADFSIYNRGTYDFDVNAVAGVVTVTGSDYAELRYGDDWKPYINNPTCQKPDPPTNYAFAGALAGFHGEYDPESFEVSIGHDYEYVEFYEYEVFEEYGVEAARTHVVVTSTVSDSGPDNTDPSTFAISVAPPPVRPCGADFFELENDVIDVTVDLAGQGMTPINGDVLQPVANVRLFWASGPDPTKDSEILIDSGSDNLQFYWNNTQIHARFTDLPEPPSNATHVIIELDIDDSFEMPDVQQAIEINRFPTPDPDTAETTENAIVTKNVLFNDTDPDGTDFPSNFLLHDTRVLETSGLTTSPLPAGESRFFGDFVEFDPGTGFDELDTGDIGQVVVGYMMSDDTGACAFSELTVTITGENDAPVARPDDAETTENAIVITDVLLNDTDIDGDDDPSNFLLHDDVRIISTTGLIVSPAPAGAVRVIDNRIEFDPGMDFDELDEDDIATVTIAYTMSDDEGESSSSVLVVRVWGENDDPVPKPDVGQTTENTNVTIDVLADDTDVDGDDDPSNFLLISADIVSTTGLSSSPAWGNWISIFDGKILFAPGNDFNELDVEDRATITINYTMSDDNGLVTGPDGTIIDEGGAVSDSNLVITVFGANDAPTAIPVPAGFESTENEIVLVDALSNDTDVDRDDNPSNFSLDDVWVANTSGLSVSVGPAGAASIVGDRIRFDPGSDFDELDAGDDAQATIAYIMSDDSGESAESFEVMHITGLNDRPVAVADSNSTMENAIVTIDVLANDTDVDANDSPSSFSLDNVRILSTLGLSRSPDIAGMAQIVNNQLEFDPGTDFAELSTGEVAPVSIEYTMSDSHGATDTAIVTVIVIGADDGSGVNHVPTVAANNGSVVVNEGSPALNGGTFSDVDLNDNVTITASIGAVTQSGTQNGTWNWSFDALDDLSQDVVITANDGQGGVATTTFGLTVNNVVPVISSVVVTPVADENEVVHLSFHSADVGTEDVFTIEIDWGDGSTSRSLNVSSGGDGMFDYATQHIYPDDPAGSPDTYAIGITVTDDDGGTTQTSTADTVTIVLTGEVYVVNGAPFGMTANVGETVSVSLTYDLGTSDSLPDNTTVGKFPQAAVSGFSYTIGNHTVESSSYFVQVGHTTGFDGLVAVASDFLINGVPVTPAEGDSQTRMDMTLNDNNGGSFQDDSLPLGFDITQFLGQNINIGQSAQSSGLPDNQIIRLRLDAATFTHLRPLHTTVNNVAPVAQVTGPTNGVNKQVVDFVFSSIDVSSPDQAAGFSYSIDWNDGITQTVPATATNGTPFTLNHVYTTPGTFNVEVSSTDKDGSTSDAATSSIVIETVADGLQTIVTESLSSSATATLTLETSTTDIDSVIAAVEALNPLTPSSETPVVEIVLNLADGIYSGQAVTLPAGVQLTIIGSDGTVWQGASPALTVTSGTVIVENITFVNSTDASTILVTGGNLIVRNSTIEETTGGNQAAVNVTGGTIDLGTFADSGNNTFIVHGTGEAVHNGSSAGVSALGNMFQIDGSTLTSPFEIEDIIFHAFDSPAFGEVSYLDGNIDPRVNVGADRTVDEGTAVSITGHFDDLNLSDTHIESWRVTDSMGTIVASGAGANIQFAPLDDATYIVDYSVTDQLGGVGTDQATITITNVAPVLNPLVLSSAQIDENGDVTIVGTFTDPGAIDRHKVAISWGDSSATTVFQLTVGERSFTATHRYLNNHPSGVSGATYPISLSVADDDGGRDLASTTILVNNVAPVVAPLVLSSSTIDENGSVTLTGTVSDQGVYDDLDEITIQWGDGSSNVVALAGHPEIADGDFDAANWASVAATAGGGSAVSTYAGGMATVDFTLNTPPVGSYSQHVEVNLLQSQTFNPATDGALAALDFSINSRIDPATEADEFVLKAALRQSGHLFLSKPFGYAWPGATRHYRAEDFYQEGQPSNHPDFSGAGGAIEFGFASSVLILDGNLDRTFGAEFDDLQFTLFRESNTQTFTATHQYLDDNPTASSSDSYTIRVNVTDDDTGFATASVDTTVRNVDPVIGNINISATKDNKAGVEEVVTLSGTFGDVGTLDTHTIIIDWNDGESSNSDLDPGDFTSMIDFGGSASFAATHNYSTGGIFAVTLTILDDDTGTTTTTTSAWVSGVRLTEDGTLQVVGTSDDDHASVNQQGNGVLKVHADFLTNGPFAKFNSADVTNIIAYLGEGDDHLAISGNVDIPTIAHGDSGDDHMIAGGGPTVLLGDAGNDSLIGGAGRAVIVGGRGVDRLVGGSGDDVLIGGSTTDDVDDDQLVALLAAWTSNDDYGARVSAIDLLLSVVDDEEEDILTGSSGLDLFYDGLGDILTDLKTKKRAETVR